MEISDKREGDFLEKKEKKAFSMKNIFRKQEGRTEGKEEQAKKGREKGAVLKKNTLLKIGRIILWIILLFVFFKGLISIFRPDTLSEAQELINDFNGQLEENKKLNQEISAFAQNYAREYLTYEAGEEDEYKKRLSVYMANSGSLEGMEIYRGAARAEYVQAYRMEQYAADKWDVYVLAEVEYVISSGQDEQTSRQETCLKVPVLAREGKMIVESLPMFLNDSMLLEDYSAAEYTGTPADDQTAGAVATAVTNFLEAYYGQNETAIEYYLAQDADREQFTGLVGRYAFYKMNSLKCYHEEGEAFIVCIADFKISDSVNEAKLQQKLRLDVVKGNDSRYYVRAITPRITK